MHAKKKWTSLISCTKTEENMGGGTSKVKVQLDKANFLLNVERQARRRFSTRRVKSTYCSCSICMDKDANIACVPCGHLCLCVDCAVLLLDQTQPKTGVPCPICRAGVRTFQQIFIPNEEDIANPTIRVPSLLSLTWSS